MKPFEINETIRHTSSHLSSNRELRAAQCSVTPRFIFFNGVQLRNSQSIYKLDLNMQRVSAVDCFLPCRCWILLDALIAFSLVVAVEGFRRCHCLQIRRRTGMSDLSFSFPFFFVFFFPLLSSEKMVSKMVWRRGFTYTGVDDAAFKRWLRWCHTTSGPLLESYFLLCCGSNNVRLH